MPRKRILGKRRQRVQIHRELFEYITGKRLFECLTNPWPIFLLPRGPEHPPFVQAVKRAARVGLIEISDTDVANFYETHGGRDETDRLLQMISARMSRLN
jgi:hypothetical protein